MARFDDNFLLALRERVDLVAVIERVTPLKKRGANWLGLCPFHQEKSPSFNVRPDKGFYKCFGCGAHGDAIDFVMQARGLPFPEAVEALAMEAGMPLPEPDQPNPQRDRERQERDRLLLLLAEAKGYFRRQLHEPAGERARRYLHGRGLSADTIARFEIGYAPPGWRNLLDRLGGGEAAVVALEQAGLVVRKEEGNVYDRFRDRIIFPIHDQRGRCVGFGGRLLGDGKPKYINSPETRLYSKSEILYGMNIAQEQLARHPRLLVTEGYMDAIAIAERGVLPVTATLGTAVTEQHMRLIWSRAKQVVFCFDGDNAGRKAAWRALERVMDGLQADRHARFLFLPEGEDPDSLVRREGEAAFMTRLDDADTPVDLLVRGLAEDLDLAAPEGRAALSHRARPLLEQVADPLLRELMAEELGARLGGLTAGQVLRGERAQRSGGWPDRSGGGRGAWRDRPAGGGRGEWRDRNQSGAPMGQPPQWRRRDSAQGADGGRDHDQALMGLLLKHPRLTLEHEEDLAKLRLKNPQLQQLLTELLERGFHRDPADEGPWSFDGMDDALRQLAKRITQNEEAELESQASELRGCLLTMIERGIQREYDQLMAGLAHAANDQVNAMMSRMSVLKQEITSLQQRRGDGRYL
ncbi:DNA primase [Magnetofaba australis]|uniref:DNA primase n=1 Tax=Magnetofaba australis IT-1 TaxID=1434232 RepID=A0A1Y2K8Y5_9PROT|nr:DNA primase [Magnetofaba australis]OSM07079.1 putative DNA primase [Magnetofaba australis IT-1]